MSTASRNSTRIHVDLAGSIHRNLPVAALIEHAISNKEGRMAANGALVAYTGKYSGRTPKDKRIVSEAGVKKDIWWDGNAPMDNEEFTGLVKRVNRALPSKSIYIVDTFAGADPEHRIAVRFVVENAYHALFIRQLLLRPTEDELVDFQPDWTVVDLSREQYARVEEGERRDAIIALKFSERTVIIMGTSYAGEMKKSIFTVMNYLLPKKGIMSMHCSANIGKDGDTALFFGLSGTGKTTLSADPDRELVGDDEHGWSDNGVFNIEGGCYAKCIRLSHESEPQIWNAIRFGSVLENVILDGNRVPDYDDGRLTENTRCAYPIDYMEGALSPSVGGHPKNIIFLTCDAFGVLPPVSRLTPEQAMFHFLNGYTAKVAGTEAGVTEPQATFSTCFGAPFMALHPKVYAELLRDKIAEHGSKVWLVNTGWSGGAYGVGKRMKLSYTRSMINAIFSGEMDDAEFAADPVFGMEVPNSCSDVPTDVLMPRCTWEDQEAYDAKALELKEMFEENFKTYA
jgi:phosphoenolpyruvate carboxykinase (ATP)